MPSRDSSSFTLPAADYYAKDACSAALVLMELSLQDHMLAIDASQIPRSAIDSWLGSDLRNFYEARPSCHGSLTKTVENQGLHIAVAAMEVRHAPERARIFEVLRLVQKYQRVGNSSLPRGSGPSRQEVHSSRTRTPGMLTSLAPSLPRTAVSTNGEDILAAQTPSATQASVAPHATSFASSSAAGAGVNPSLAGHGISTHGLSSSHVRWYDDSHYPIELMIKSWGKSREQRSREAQERAAAKRAAPKAKRILRAVGGGPSNAQAGTKTAQTGRQARPRKRRRVEKENAVGGEGDETESQEVDDDATVVGDD